MPFTKIFISLIFLFRITIEAQANNSSVELLHPDLVSKFYDKSDHKFFWVTASLRNKLFDIINKAENLGLNKNKYHYSSISELLRTQGVNEIEADKVLTDAALALLKDIYTGANEYIHLGYDGISAKYKDADDDRIVTLLLGISNEEQLAASISDLEPKNDEYILLKAELKKQLNEKVQDKITKICFALNYYRWIHHFEFKKFIVVNICSTVLSYYEHDSVQLDMKIVVGKPSTKTPRFAAYCNEVILYPYWNVPRSIAVNEILPSCKRNPKALNSLNLQVLDRTGNIINAGTINWKQYTKASFPYRFRQSTGCDNALGVLKFNLTSPFSVYMHDTNYKNAFASKKRYLSHGCIRIEKPIDLANNLIAGRLDTNFLKSCVRKQTPSSVRIEKPIPVFVVYMPVENMNGEIIYYDDIYRLLH